MINKSEETKGLALKLRLLIMNIKNLPDFLQLR